MLFSNLELAKVLVVFPGFFFLSSLEAAPHGPQCTLIYASVWGWKGNQCPADPFGYATWAVQKCRKRAGSAADPLSFPRVEFFKETSDTIPLLTPNSSEWSGIEAAVVHAVHTRCISQTHWERKLCQENWDLSWGNNASLGYSRVHSAFAQLFVLGCAWSLKLAHKEFPNSYYSMSSQLILRIILQMEELFQRCDSVSKRLILIQ